VLTRSWVAFGLLYGVGIYVVMNWVVLPLSALHAWPHPSMKSVALNGFAMLLFGLIVAYFAQRYRGSSAVPAVAAA
jgi:hypothetical protein